MVFFFLWFPEKLACLTSKTMNNAIMINDRKFPSDCFVSIDYLLYFCSVFWQVSLVPGQVVEYKYGLVTKPADEIWITVQKRK